MTKNNITLEITDLIDSDEQLVKIVKSMDSKINNIPENIHTKHKIIMNKSKMIKIKNVPLQDTKQLQKEQLLLKLTRQHKIQHKRRKRKLLVF
jgi:hypothetical protein